MKTVAVYPVHYGAEYLAHSIEAIEPAVDRIVVAYTESPSFGRPAQSVCPDTEDDLRAACSAAGSKLHWVSGTWHSEGAHRQAAYEIARGLAGPEQRGLIVQCDADEVWDTGALQRCIREAADSNAQEYAIRGTGWTHFWRSFGWCCRDVWSPVRILKMHGAGGARSELDGRIYHFGYAQAAKIVAYKWTIHGHQNELRPGWFEDVFMGWPNRKDDLHPCVRHWWNAEPFDRQTLPQVLRRHSYFDRDVIA